MVEDWVHYFEPAQLTVAKAFEGSDVEFLASQVTAFHSIGTFDPEQFDVAIIGVADGLNSSPGVAKLPNALRNYLYGMRAAEKPIRIIDLGNLLGRTLDDRYSALEDIVQTLIGLEILPVVIGGSQDYTLPLVAGVRKLKEHVRLAIIDSRVDWQSTDHSYSSDSYLGVMMEDVGRCPEDVAIVGVQKYFLGKHQEGELRRKNFDFLRLGEIRKSGVRTMEPWLRDADAISLDMRAVKQGDQPAHRMPCPNGLDANDICQAAWYAGVSDKLKCFSIFELDVDRDVTKAGTCLSAQVLWHFLEGVLMRYADYPMRDLDSYAQYIVHLDDYEIDIKFYNNPDNDRWWVEIPKSNGEKDVVACDRTDFDLASRKEIPERWFRFVQKC